jgi:hypothetical protein
MHISPTHYGYCFVLVVPGWVRFSLDSNIALYQTIVAFLFPHDLVTDESNE